MEQARVTVDGWELAADEMLREPGRQVAARASIAQAQIIQQRLHDGRMAGVADGTVIEVAYLAGQGLTQSAETPRGIERFVEDAVQ